jgi:predicted ribosomally synthesized peptide with nif11-like leader
VHHAGGHAAVSLAERFLAGHAAQTSLIDMGRSLALLSFGSEEEGGTMSAHAAEAFFEKLVTDEKFRDQFLNVSDPNAVLKKAQDAGFDFAPDEMKSVLAKDKRLPDVSDDDLDSLAAGDIPGWLVGPGPQVPTTDAIAAGAAAAACV